MEQPELVTKFLTALGALLTKGTPGIGKNTLKTPEST